MRGVGLRYAGAKGSVAEKDECMDEKWIMEAFEHAIPPGEFFLQYQPVIRLLDSRVYGAESLIRWRYPEHGLVLWTPSTSARTTRPSCSIIEWTIWT